MKKLMAPSSDDWLSLTDPVALFHEIGWLCHRRIFTESCFLYCYYTNEFKGRKLKIPESLTLSGSFSDPSLYKTQFLLPC